MDEREQLRQAFNSNFGFCYAELPAEFMVPGRVCHIRIIMGNLYVVLGEQGGHEYLEYVWSSRMDMVDYRHSRLYADGSRVDLNPDETLDAYEEEFETPWRRHGFAVTNETWHHTVLSIWLGNSVNQDFRDVLQRMREDAKRRGVRLD